jgi:hypothetical protein
MRMNISEVLCLPQKVKVIYESPSEVLRLSQITRDQTRHMPPMHY